LIGANLPAESAATIIATYSYVTDLDVVVTIKLSAIAETRMPTSCSPNQSSSSYIE